MSTSKDFNNIKLTHIINPHMFWFQKDTGYCCNEKYWALEEAILKYFRSVPVSVNQKRFAVGEIATVFLSAWGKWIRVVVDRICPAIHGKTICVLWALDWGFPLKADEEQVEPLPIKFAEYEPRILYYGGLNYIVPIETTFDFNLLKSVKTRSKDWSESVVKHFRMLIDEASNLKFVLEFDSGGHMFGRLEITTHGRVVDAIDILLQIPGVLKIVDNEQFLSALHSGNTTKIKRFHDNWNRLSISDLNKNIVKRTSHNLDKNYNCDFVVKDISLNKASPSKYIANIVVDSNQRDFETDSDVRLHESDSETNTLILDHVEFDSVSNAPSNIGNMAHFYVGDKRANKNENVSSILTREPIVARFIKSTTLATMPVLSSNSSYVSKLLESNEANNACNVKPSEPQHREPVKESKKRSCL